MAMANMKSTCNGCGDSFPVSDLTDIGDDLDQLVLCPACFERAGGGDTTNSKKLTDIQAELIIRKGLRDRDWTEEGIARAINALNQNMWGPWTYATVTMAKDLAEIFQEMVSDHGDPPDEDS
jgi:hypothetical protein